MRDGELESAEAKRVFNISVQLRELKRSDKIDRRALKLELLDEIEVTAMHTSQRSIATACKKLLREFAYLRDDERLRA